jgi:uncharacterized protein (DUF1800 family)
MSTVITPMNNVKQIKHLYSRAGFGIRFKELHVHENASVKKKVKELFKSSEADQPITIVTENIDLRPKTDDPELKKKNQEDRNQQDKDLNTTWLKQMANSDAQLRERMTLFWHNHFACNINNAYHQQQLNNIQRTHALGNFKTLLTEVSQSPAMLTFLNNQQNVKGHPNENFARELMELFTLGIGHYTEQDIKESARAFTGWHFDGKTSAYTFVPRIHDDGQKTFMSKTANFCGEDIIDIILSNKQTAIFICTKLYRYLVNDTPDPIHIGEMAGVFYQADYELKPLLEFVFLSDWFYDGKNIGVIIKSPVQLLVSLTRQFYIDYHNPDVLLQFERTLGQVLFKPPNVAGWPGGRAWIDSSSLMYRIKIASTLLNAGVIDFTGKATPEDEAFLAATHKQQFNVIKRTQAVPDWGRFLQDIPLDFPRLQVAEFMLEPKLNQTVIDEVNQAPDIKSMVIQIASTPEYQLC